MDESAFNIGQRFDFLLETNANVNSFGKPKIIGQKNVDFHEEVRAEMVGAHGIDLSHQRRMMKGDPGQLLKELLRCRVAGQITNVYYRGRDDRRKVTYERRSALTTHLRNPTNDDVKADCDRA